MFARSSDHRSRGARVARWWKGLCGTPYTPTTVAMAARRIIAGRGGQVEWCMRKVSLTRREFLVLTGAGVAACAAPGTGVAPAASKAVTLESVVASAKAEGKINAAGPSTLGESGFNKILEGVNKKHGLSLQGTYSSSGNLPDIVAKVATEASTG